MGEFDLYFVAFYKVQRQLISPAPLGELLGYFEPPNS
jgi:hypothetical protein